MTKQTSKGAQARLEEAYPKQFASSNFHKQKQFEFYEKR